MYKVKSDRLVSQSFLDIADGVESLIEMHLNSGHVVDSVSIWSSGDAMRERFFAVIYWHSFPGGFRDADKNEEMDKDSADVIRAIWCPAEDAAFNKSKPDAAGTEAGGADSNSVDSARVSTGKELVGDERDLQADCEGARLADEPRAGREGVDTNRAGEPPLRRGGCVSTGEPSRPAVTVDCSCNRCGGCLWWHYECSVCTCNIFDEVH